MNVNIRNIYLEVIDQTRERVFPPDFQTPRSRLEKRGAAKFFLTASRCFELGGNTLSSV